MTARKRCFAGFGLLALAFALDPWAYGGLRAVILYEHWGEMRELMTTAKFLGSGLGTFVIGLTIGVLDPIGWKRAKVVWLVFLLTGTCAVVVKIATGRERPSHLDQVPGCERLAFKGPVDGIDAPFQSFPSGHAASAFGTATCVATFYPPARAVFYAAAIATATNRVVKHQHFLSDVVAGAMLGHLLAVWLLAVPRIKRSWR